MSRNVKWTSRGGITGSWLSQRHSSLVVLLLLLLVACNTNVIAGVQAATFHHEVTWGWKPVLMNTEQKTRKMASDIMGLPYLTMDFICVFFLEEEINLVATSSSLASKNLLRAPPPPLFSYLLAEWGWEESEALEYGKVTQSSTNHEAESQHGRALWSPQRRSSLCPSWCLAFASILSVSWLLTHHPSLCLHGHLLFCPCVCVLSKSPSL